MTQDEQRKNQMEEAVIALAESMKYLDEYQIEEVMKRCGVRGIRLSLEKIEDHE